MSRVNVISAVDHLAADGQSETGQNFADATENFGHRQTLSFRDAEEERRTQERIWLRLDCGLPAGSLPLVVFRGQRQDGHGHRDAAVEIMKAQNEQDTCEDDKPESEVECLVCKQGTLI